jgi:glucan phosphoethanolaminetransferase (alkaline phosphatase superfamily)
LVIYFAGEVGELKGFSKIFIFWGVLFIFNSLITVFAQMNKEHFMGFFSQYPITGYLFPVGFIALLAALIYWKISRKIPLVGLEKHLMTIWMLILVMNVIPNKIMVSSVSPAIDLKTVTIQSNNFSTMLFSLAVGLIVTALFTEFKPLMKLGISIS